MVQENAEHVQRRRLGFPFLRSERVGEICGKNCGEIVGKTKPGIHTGQ
jgi:hypothetical protein